MKYFKWKNENKMILLEVANLWNDIAIFNFHSLITKKNYPSLFLFFFMIYKVLKMF